MGSLSAYLGTAGDDVTMPAFKNGFRASDIDRRMMMVISFAWLNADRKNLSRDRFEGLGSGFSGRCGATAYQTFVAL